MAYKIYTNHTLEEYNKKYRNRKYRLLKYTKKEVEEFDRINNSTENSKFKLAYNADGIHAIELPGNKIAAAFYNNAPTSFEYLGKNYSLSELGKEFIQGKGAFGIFNKKQ